MYAVAAARTRHAYIMTGCEVIVFHCSKDPGMSSETSCILESVQLTMVCNSGEGMLTVKWATW